jgi:hypothetical protein
MIRAALALAALLLATSAHAATIQVDASGNPPALVALSGTLELGDEDTFRTKTANLSNAIVALFSEGGNVHAGIDIGTQVRMKGYATVVPPKALCVSACGLIWLGGTSRAIMYDKRGNYGRVGFHAAVNSKNGQQSVGNAWVGAYFARLGLSDAVITYLTDAQPDDMQWLTPQDNERYGINAKYVEIDPEQARPQAPLAKRNGIDVAPLNAPVTTAGVPPSDTPANRPVVPNAQRTVWNHNGSLVYLEVDGSGRRFYYQQPRPGMAKAGARPGTLLFDGQSIGGNYFGTAYIFNRQCGFFPYSVQGRILDDGSRIKMIGQAPRVDQQCNVTGYLEDTLEFKLAAGD